ncbi:hypothetical protein WICPIJ_005322 [Wickerhamomyces pijperi]|uniref:Pre-rRNA-processing protein TSR2 n=1 Tax=Wickerhamomyces pijperi TaxID=599730 RepID=A0A9P8TL81_WICPI|nr:hypothetical protein WICPIJ_005322 [Wickerhamomyces pijperi]
MSIQIDSSDYVESPTDTLHFSNEKQQANFALGVSMSIHSWEVLETAVVNGWGGPQSSDKRDWITSIVLDLFEGKIVDIELVEETLLNAMIDEFDVQVEDDSSLIIADRIVKVYRACALEQYGEIHQAYHAWQLKQQNRAQRDASLRVVVQEDPNNPDDSDEDEEDEEDYDAPQLVQEDVMEVEEPQGPIVDEDGFEMVQKKGRRRH